MSNPTHVTRNDIPTAINTDEAGATTTKSPRAEGGSDTGTTMKQPPDGRQQPAQHPDGVITCFGYGIDRAKLYPDYYFCRPCQLYEKYVVQNPNRKKPHRDDKRYKCTAGHTNYLHPTVLKIDMNQLLRLQKQNKHYKALLDATLNAFDRAANEDLYDTDDAACDERSTNSERMRREELERLQGRIERIKKKINEYKEQWNEVKSRVEVKTKMFNSISLPNLMNEFTERIGVMASLKNRKMENTAEYVINSLFYSNMMDGLLKEKMLQITREHLREKYFHPKKIAALMETHQGYIPPTALRTLRLLETKGVRGLRDTVIPSDSQIKRAINSKYNNTRKKSKISDQDDIDGDDHDNDDGGFHSSNDNNNMITNENEMEPQTDMEDGFNYDEQT